MHKPQGGTSPIADDANVRDVTCVAFHTYWAWLKVPERIQYRLCVLTYLYLHGMAPPYLAKTLQLTTEVDARCRLRLASTSTLIVSSTRRSTLGDWAFPMVAARAWTPCQLVSGRRRHWPASVSSWKQHFSRFQASYPKHLYSAPATVYC